MTPCTPSLIQPLPFEAWSTSKTTLQLYAQIVGKLQLRYTHLRNHWWNITFRPTSRGMATHVMHEGDVFFEIAFDFVDHLVVVNTNRSSEPGTIALRDGLSVKSFENELFVTLRKMGLENLRISPTPYGQTDALPFAEDETHNRYDQQMVRRWWEATLWTNDVLNEFGLPYVGKQSEPQLFWHSFDLAVGRFSGKPSAAPQSPNLVMREAYSGEVIAFGFWAGDANIPAPTYYTYTSPEPTTLTEMTLRPTTAHWAASGAGHLGLLAYDIVRGADDPRATLLDFFESGFEAGSLASGWATSDLLRVERA